MLTGKKVVGIHILKEKKNQCNGDKSRLSIWHQSFVVIERLSTLINKGV